MFWKSLEQPGPGEEGFALKVAIKDGEDVEHFWLIDVAREGGKLSGTINNEPGIVGNVANGERYEFTEADISDWLFMRNGKMVGNETMRPLLKRMPKPRPTSIAPCTRRLDAVSRPVPAAPAGRFGRPHHERTSRLKFGAVGPNQPLFGEGAQCALSRSQGRGHSSAGRALAWHARGHRFDPGWLHHFSLRAVATPTLRAVVPVRT